ncbi:MAG: hypothetical protein JO328_12195 [Hyphomicrobiales bacterium]|nr:hypothetical protein [Hyphomicrobiales bacterium]MBV8826117.1 hypothetical protein [Hyphomicrobiales bacterium]
MLFRRALIFALLLLASIAPSAAQVQPPTPDATAEIDAKLNSLKSDILGSTYSRTAIDERIGRIEAQLGSLKQTLDKIDTDLRDTARMLNSRMDTEASYQQTLIKSIDARVSGVPWWWSVGLAAFLSFIVSGTIAEYGRRKSVAQSVAQSAAQRAADHAQRVADQTNLAIDDWLSSAGTFANVSHFFTHSDELVNNNVNMNIIIGVGNWYERLAQKWLAGDVNGVELEANNIRNEMRDFWRGLENLKIAKPPVDFSPQQKEWQSLQQLAT